MAVQKTVFPIANQKTGLAQRYFRAGFQWRGAAGWCWLDHILSISIYFYGPHPQPASPVMVVRVRRDADVSPDWPHFK